MNLANLNEAAIKYLSLRFIYKQAFQPHEAQYRTLYECSTHVETRTAPAVRPCLADPSPKRAAHKRDLQCAGYAGRIAPGGESKSPFWQNPKSRQNPKSSPVTNCRFQPWNSRKAQGLVEARPHVNIVKMNANGSLSNEDFIGPGTLNRNVFHL